MQTHAISQRLRGSVWLAHMIAFVERFRIIDPLPVERMRERLMQLGRVDLLPGEQELRHHYIARLRRAQWEDATLGVKELRRLSTMPSDDDRWKRVCDAIDRKAEACAEAT